MTSEETNTTISGIPGPIGESNQSRLSSRKFIIACGFGLVSSAALFADKLGGGEFVAVVTLVLGIYSAGNVGHHYVKKV